MEITEKEIKRSLDVPAIITDAGTELPFFDSMAVARALELEISKAASMGLTHIRINMRLLDANAFAIFLRRASQLGA